MRSSGSSPRMRGALKDLVCPGLGTRIIPAHAGSTYENTRPRLPDRDHPRACGEHSNNLANNIFQSGSSPRMRGARSPWPRAYTVCRIIPAHAGSTCLLRYGRAGSGDHPRACGEHIAEYVAKPTRQGSSPRMRGAPLMGLLQYVAHRIIPAHAGSTRIQ